MNRQDVTALVLEAKRARGLSFADLVDRLGADRVWLTAALHGQHPLGGERAGQLVELLQLPAAAAVLQEIPLRGSLDVVPPAADQSHRR